MRRQRFSLLSGRVSTIRTLSPTLARWALPVVARTAPGSRSAARIGVATAVAIAAERNAVGFVLGLPVNMDASEGPRAQSTRAFARNFSRLTDLAIALWDERLSTAAVEP